MTVEAQIAALTDQTTQLLDVFSQLPAIVNANVSLQLEQNTGFFAAVSANLISTQAQLVLLTTQKAPRK